MKRRTGSWMAWSTALGLFLAPVAARAAGLFVAPRGVRPLAMGGAYVAGANDVNALSYNPAGLSDAGDMLLLDAALPMTQTTYSRSVYGDGLYDIPVQGTGLGMPSPTLGAVYGFHWRDDVRFGLGITADYPSLQNWPSSIDDPTTPQRYAMENYAGTALAKVIVGGAVRVNDWLSLGATGQLLVGNFAATTSVSTCDGVMCTQPENPAYDAAVQMRAHGLVVPGLQVGAKVRATTWLTLGLAWESAYNIQSPVDLSIRLPSAAAYNTAALAPGAPRGTIKMTLPSQLRAGVMATPLDTLHIELAAIYEPWSAHDAITVTTGGASLQNVTGLDAFALNTITIPQGYRDTWSVRLGGEWQPPIDALPLTVRLGAMFEPSAIPSTMLTPMVVDLDKLLGAVGVQYALKTFTIQATYAHVFMLSQTVTQSQVYQTNPTQTDTSQRTPIGNGIYTAGADIFGMGVRIDI